MSYDHRRDSGFDTPLCQCPVCSASLDAASPGAGQDDVPPTAGDFTICLYCASILVFAEGMRLRKSTFAEKEEFMRDPAGIATLSAVIGALREAKLKPVSLK